MFKNLMLILSLDNFMLASAQQNVGCQIWPSVES